jgi:hypothetical protein
MPIQVVFITYNMIPKPVLPKTQRALDIVVVFVFELEFSSWS